MPRTSRRESKPEPLAVGRRNWLHLGGDGGLRRRVVLLSVAASVKRHAVNSWAYLKHLTDGTNAWASGADLAELLLDRWIPAGMATVG
jgi:hypothetical protein